MNYRDYNNFDNENFREDLLLRLAIANTKAKDTSFFDCFLNMPANYMPPYTPWKQKCVRGYHLPFMNKALKKS